MLTFLSSSKLESFWLCSKFPLCFSTFSLASVIFFLSGHSANSRISTTSGSSPWHLRMCRYRWAWNSWQNVQTLYRLSLNCTSPCSSDSSDSDSNSVSQSSWLDSLVSGRSCFLRLLITLFICSRVVFVRLYTPISFRFSDDIWCVGHVGRYISVVSQ